MKVQLWTSILADLSTIHEGYSMSRLLYALVALFKNKNLSAVHCPPEVKIRTLGSTHGGKTYVELSNISSGLVVCAGAGEDISFDIELASTEKCNVAIIDPTPKAVEHFSEVSKRFGLPSTSGYSASGQQPVQAYDLRTLSKNTFRFIEKALWKEVTFVDFFPPKDPLHVSHSILNLQQNRRGSTPLRVETITLKSVLSTSEFQSISLLKLDIEGGAYAVCKTAFRERVFPRQIIIEFDELIHPTWQGLIRIFKLTLLLRKFKYQAVHSSGFESTFLRKIE
jgi:FkbM family methyltransferase